MTPAQIKKVRFLKGTWTHEILYCARDIPIYNESGEQLGRLQPIDTELAQDAEIAASLAKWRQTAMHCFLTQYQATGERTLNWLQNVVIPNDDRILFLMRDKDDRAIGNFGICNISSQGVELDNLIRGEKGGGARFIYFAEIAFLHWIYGDMVVGEVVLRAFSNNHTVLSLHKSVGFEKSEETPLYKIEEENQVRYVTAPVPNAQEADKSLITMQLSKQRFYERHSWIYRVYNATRKP